MRIPGSVRFAAIVLGIIAVVWLGWKGYAAFVLRNVVLSPIEPGRINVVAISPNAGYRIIVANQIAYLAKVEGAFAAGEMDERTASEDVSNASRLPLRELMQTLQGDDKAVGVLVMRLNDWKEVDEENSGKVWRAEDIEKALGGDKELLSRLEENLNVDMKGNGLPQIDLRALMNGIVIDSPVAVKVSVNGKEQTLIGRVQESYQPLLCAAVEERINKEFNPSTDFIKGVYTDEVKRRGASEDVRRSLERRIDKKRMQELAVPAQRVLDNTVVILNEKYINSASFTTYDMGQGHIANDIRIGLTDDGHMRLWKYSHEHDGFQLLFVVDTIAIAAPRITTELAERTVTIRRVPSKVLVADAIDLLNEIIKKKK
ncbi:MAG TPA: hypothetical protein VNI20_14230 [Fimbriimonadaceae bacterium]|nr:hypothetical protein [Fimbriimonadaceae bacterium]